MGSADHQRQGEGQTEEEILAQWSDAWAIERLSDSDLVAQRLVPDPHDAGHAVRHDFRLYVDAGLGERHFDSH